MIRRNDQNTVVVVVLVVFVVFGGPPFCVGGGGGIGGFISVSQSVSRVSQSINQLHYRVVLPKAVYINIYAVLLLVMIQPVQQQRWSRVCESTVLPVVLVSIH